MKTVLWNIYFQVAAYVIVLSLKVLIADLWGDMFLLLTVWDPVLIAC